MKSEAREKIRAAAVHLFAEKGYSATATREICLRAGVTKPVLYYHFESKEQLYRKLILDAFNESHKQLILASKPGKTAREKLVNILAADFALTKRDPKLATVFFRLIFAPPRELPAVDYIRMGMDRARFIEGVVKEGIRRKEMHGQPQGIARAIMGAFVIYSLLHLLTGEPKLDRNLARRIVGLVVDGCGIDCIDRQA